MLYIYRNIFYLPKCTPYNLKITLELMQCMTLFVQHSGNVSISSWVLKNAALPAKPKPLELHHLHFISFCWKLHLCLLVKMSLGGIRHLTRGHLLPVGPFFRWTCKTCPTFLKTHFCPNLWVTSTVKAPSVVSQTSCPAPAFDKLRLCSRTELSPRRSSVLYKKTPQVPPDCTLDEKAVLPPRLGCCMKGCRSVSQPRAATGVHHDTVSVHAAHAWKSDRAEWVLFPLVKLRGNLMAWVLLKWAAKTEHLLCTK